MLVKCAHSTTNKTIIDKSDVGLGAEGGGGEKWVDFGMGAMDKGASVCAWGREAGQSVYNRIKMQNFNTF